MKQGFIVEFKRGKFWSVSGILGNILKLFQRDWDAWGWHLAVARQKVYDGWNILEATSEGVKVNFYNTKFLEENTRNYQWLDKPPSLKAMDKFYQEHIGKKYDVAIYFWTALQYLIRHYFNHRIPRLLDDQFTCWELVFEFVEEMGKPIGSKYDCPMIADAIKAFNENTVQAKT